MALPAIGVASLRCGGARDSRSTLGAFPPIAPALPIALSPVCRALLDCRSFNPSTECVIAADLAPVWLTPIVRDGRSYLRKSLRLAELITVLIHPWQRLIPATARVRRAALGTCSVFDRWSVQFSTGANTVRRPNTIGHAHHFRRHFLRSLKWRPRSEYVAVREIVAIQLLVGDAECLERASHRSRVRRLARILLQRVAISCGQRAQRAIGRIP
jgi:hypothetical protein